jgi:hypothetical protein
MNKILENHFRIPAGMVEIKGPQSFTAESGFFRFGPLTHCYGRRWTECAKKSELSHDSASSVRSKGGVCFLPFDLQEIVDGLRYERYISGEANQRVGSLARAVYYAIRPLLPVGLRRYAQRRALRGWNHPGFPVWPVDRTVDLLLEQVLLLAMEARGLQEIPFVWFWPDGSTGCITMTHDVETKAGLRFCEELMQMNERYRVPASFQLIPGARYCATLDDVAGIRGRGFEVNVHDWKHDGAMFSSRQAFLEASARVQGCVEEWNVKGFRSGALYRNPDWISEMKIAYDMSVPTSGRLEAQPGGCCSLFPWFFATPSDTAHDRNAGSVLEIPVTMTQDYSLFHVLQEYSLSTWEAELAEVLNGNGLASFIVHPDYIRGNREQRLYLSLLEQISRLRSDHKVWVAAPAEIHQWWSLRAGMTLVRMGDGWCVEGEGSERASIAWARRSEEGLYFKVDQMVSAEGELYSES